MDERREPVAQKDPPERFQAKWRPVRVKKTRQIKNLEPRFDSIETEKALAKSWFAARRDTLYRKCSRSKRLACAAVIIGAGDPFGVATAGVAEAATVLSPAWFCRSTNTSMPCGVTFIAKS